MATGHGILTKKSGYRYEGGWKDNDYHGFARIIQQDGAKYEGNFQNGYRHGKGKHISITGEVHHEIWNEGNL